MAREEIIELLDEAERIFSREAKLISLDWGEIIFIGDTHGDFEATEKIVKRYFKAGCKLVFLGDYVDRGPASLENINFLLRQKIAHPDAFYLLMGNHEGYALVNFHPADFWETLDLELRRRYAEVFSKLPLAVSTPNGIIALHGALPDVPTLKGVNGIKLGSEQWHQITWGDWQEREGGFLGIDPYTGRPQFGRGWFERIMSRWGKNVLIRSHQPSASPVMFGGRCLTIFTSSAYRSYVAERTVALVDLEREIKHVSDLKIETI